GFVLDDLDIVRDTIRSGDTFSAILSAHGVSQVDIIKIANDYNDTCDVSRIRKGKPYAIIKAKDSLNTTKAFIYEKDKIEYTVIDFDEDIKIENKQRKVTYKEHYAHGVITSSLAQALHEQNLSPLMTDRLATIYAWTIN